jgi:hypothetical protein
MKAKTNVEWGETDRRSLAEFRDYLKQALEALQATSTVPKQLVPEARMRGQLEKTLAALVPGRPSGSQPKPEILQGLVTLLDELSGGERVSESKAGQLLNKLQQFDHETEKVALSRARSILP